MSTVRPDQNDVAHLDPASERSDERAETIVGVVCCCISAAVGGVLAVLLTPLYIGSVIAPVALVVAAATNAILPVLVRSLTRSTMAAVLPLIVWIVVVLVLSLPRPEGDVMLPGGSRGQTAVSYGVVLVGVLAGTIAIALSGARSRRAIGPAERPSGGRQP
jgi:hypothetical protein